MGDHDFDCNQFLEWKRTTIEATRNHFFHVSLDPSTYIEVMLSHRFTVHSQENFRQEGKHGFVRTVLT